MLFMSPIVLFATASVTTGDQSRRGRRRLRLISDRRCSERTLRRREFRDGFVVRLCTGGANAHGKLEYVVLEDMEKIKDIIKTAVYNVE